MPQSSNVVFFAVTQRRLGTFNEQPESMLWINIGFSSSQQWRSQPRNLEEAKIFGGQKCLILGE